MALFSAFLLGLLASFTPCVIVLIPALMYRFSGENFDLKHFGIFSAMFVLVFFVMAQFFSYLFSSSIKFGFHLGMGVLFIVLGVLALFNKINPLSFPAIKNPYLFGLVFALIISANPCSFSFLGIILASGKFAVFDIMIFSIGLLVPAILFVIFGNTLLKYVGKAMKVTKGMSYLMNVLLIAMGVYLIIEIKSFGVGDSIAAAIMILLSFYVVMKTTYFFKHKVNLVRILILIALLGIIVASIIHCNHYVDNQQQEKLNYLDGNSNEPVMPTCSAKITDCATCTRCISIFSISALIGGLGIFLMSITVKKKHELD